MAHEREQLLLPLEGETFNGYEVFGLSHTSGWRMSFLLPGVIAKVGLGPAAVFGFLIDYLFKPPSAKRPKPRCNPSYATLQKLLCVDRKTLIRWITRLKDVGLVRQSQKSRRASCEYDLVWHQCFLDGFETWPDSTTETWPDSTTETWPDSTTEEGNPVSRVVESGANDTCQNSTRRKYTEESNLKKVAASRPSEHSTATAAAGTWERTFLALRDPRLFPLLANSTERRIGERLADAPATVTDPTLARWIARHGPTLKEFLLRGKTEPDPISFTLKAADRVAAETADSDHDPATGDLESIASIDQRIRQRQAEQLAACRKLREAE